MRSSIPRARARFVPRPGSSIRTVSTEHGVANGSSIPDRSTCRSYLVRAYEYHLVAPYAISVPDIAYHAHRLIRA
eukprot:3940575-Rhodomonas_salina.1